jgi:hypothetical protein
MKAVFLSSCLFCCLSIEAQNNYKFLDINQVKAGVANRGDMHWNSSTGNASYEVPVGLGAHSDFASGLWIGGLDATNQLHIAAQTYRQSGVDFWPGPLDTTNATVSSTVSNQYDKIWKLNQADINAFITNFSNGNVQNGSYTPVADLVSWPAQGAGNYSKNLAPFMDVNNNHIYDPLVGGDYPIIKGDQSLYFIFNDNLSAHQATGSPALKVEVHATAYAYGNSAIASQYPFLSNTTFYNYKIVNRSNLNYHNAFVALWTDVDLGYYGDDYIGCNVGGNYGYAYNADNNDETVGGTVGYGANPPAAGYQVLKGPFMPNDGKDNNNDGIIDESCEQQLMSRFTYFNNMFPGVPIQSTDPQNGAQYYNYMSGYWKDNSPFTCGGNAYGGSIPTPFVYPGNTYSNSPCGAASWSEAGVPGDRRYMIGIGPFDFNSQSIHEIEYAHCTSFDYVNQNPLQKFKIDMQMLRAFTDVFNPSNCILNSVKEEFEQSSISLYPNPTNSQLIVSFAENERSIGDVIIMDVYGKELIVKQKVELSQITLDVQDLSSGIYFAKVMLNGKSTTKKFIKE